MAAARAEQARYERVRRDALPWTLGGSGPCDERIGRFCLSHGGSDSKWEPPAEPERVTAARERLIERLEAATAALPGDGWIAGQLVRYLVEADRHPAAAASARRCRAEAWWCAALLGFALHDAGDAAGADSAFSAALARMPDREREIWTDLSVILDDCRRSRYRRAIDADRAAFESRFWRLADPFLSRPGNELRSEHLSRSVWHRLQDRAASTDRIPWGDDLRLITLRYGWPKGWERIRDTGPGIRPASIVAHFGGADQDLLPPCEALGGSVREGEWDAEPPRPRTSYALPVADSTVRWLTTFEHQIAVFRDGDSAVIVAAYEIPADSLRAAEPLDAALAVLPEGGTRPGVESITPAGRAGVVAASAPPGALLLSLEVLAPRSHRAVRVRRGLEIAPLVSGRLAVSDLLLLRDAEESVASLDEAMEVARTGTRARAGERLGLYWEMYGAQGDAPESVTFTLRLVEERPGLLRRLARGLGIVAAVPPVRVRWSERPSRAGVYGRAVSIGIPPELRPGPYLIELTLASPGREPVVVRRSVTIEASGG